MAVFHVKCLKPWNRVHWFWLQMTVLCTVHVVTGKCNKRDRFSWLWDLHLQALSTVYLFIDFLDYETFIYKLYLLSISLLIFLIMRSSFTSSIYCLSLYWFSWLWDLHLLALSTVYLFIDFLDYEIFIYKLYLLSFSLRLLGQHACSDHVCSADKNCLKQCAQSCQADHNIIYTNLTAGYPHRFLFQPCMRMSSFQIFVKTLTLLPEEPITA